jgi:hypothetical protein
MVELEGMGQAEGGSYMKLDRGPISLAVSKRFSEPLFRSHGRQMRRGGDSTGNRGIMCGRRMVQWAGKSR